MPAGTRPAGLPRRIARKWWTWLNTPGRFHVRKPAKFWTWRKWRLGKKQPVVRPVNTKVYMYDDVTISLIPRTAKAVAGYVDGRWQTYLKLKLRCPRAKRVSIAVFAADNADVLDVEPHDAVNAQAASWVKRQRARRKAGIASVTSLPVLYTAASNGEAMIAVCTKAGLEYGKDYLWWSAHYDPALGEHICNPKCYPGLKHTAHATQFTDHADGVSLDESVCTAGFFASKATPV